MARKFFRPEFENHPQAAQVLRDLDYFKIAPAQPFSLDDVELAMQRSGARFGLYGAELTRLLKIVYEAMQAIESAS